MDIYTTTGRVQRLIDSENIIALEGDWTSIKEVLGLTIDAEAGIVALPERKLQELLTLVTIPETQHCMGQKDLEPLVGKLCSMHVVEPGAVSHLYHSQHNISQKGVDRAWLSPSFHQQIADWRALAVQMAARPIHLDKNVHRKLKHLGFSNDLVLGVGGVWLDPSRSGHKLAWHHPLPPDIIAYLFLSKNLEGNITKSKLLACPLVFSKATLLVAVPTERIAVPCAGSDNMPIVL